MSEIVVLLHGILRSRKSMRVLEKALQQDGYEVINIDYPSRKKSIADIASIIYRELQPYVENIHYKIHFVTHSMGGLIVRELFKYPIHNIGRVVMLAPPNQGSEVADFLKNVWLYQWLFGPAGQELTTSISKNAPFPLVNAELGIIAGNRWIDPISSFLLSIPHDGKVTIESTKLGGMKDHIVLPANHSFMMYNKKVIQQVKEFLKNGQFDH